LQDIANAKREKRRQAIAVFFLLLTAIAGFWGFLFVWGSLAVQVQEQVGEVVSSQADLRTSVFSNYTITFENYGLTSHTLFLRGFSTGYQPFVILGTGELQKDNLTIDQVRFQEFYGTQPLRPPFVENNVPLQGLPRFFPIPRLTKVIVQIRFHYKLTGNDSQLQPLVYPDPQRTYLAQFVPALSTFEGYFGAFPYRAISLTLPVVFFTGFGASIGYLRRRVHTISNAFHDLGRTKNQEDLRRSLAILAYDPNLLGYGWGAIFAPAVTFFKMSVRRRVASLNYQSEKGRSELKPDSNSVFDKFLKNGATQPAATLSEFRTISLIIAFLASVGLTFSWNVGAIGPFLTAVGLSYLSCNLGFLAVLVRRHSFDLLVVILLIAFAFAVVSITQVIVTLRALPSRFG